MDILGLVTVPMSGTSCLISPVLAVTTLTGVIVSFATVLKGDRMIKQHVNWNANGIFLLIILMNTRILII